MIDDVNVLIRILQSRGARSNFIDMITVVAACGIWQATQAAGQLLTRATRMQQLCQRCIAGAPTTSSLQTAMTRRMQTKLCRQTNQVISAAGQVKHVQCQPASET